MKVTVMYVKWYADFSKETGLTKNGEYDITLNTIQEITEKGLYVMFNKYNGSTYMWIDNKRFTQR